MQFGSVVELACFAKPSRNPKLSLNSDLSIVVPKPNSFQTGSGLIGKDL